MQRPENIKALQANGRRVLDTAAPVKPTSFKIWAELILAVSMVYMDAFWADMQYEDADQDLVTRARDLIATMRDGYKDLEISQEDQSELTKILALVDEIIAGPH